MSVKACRQELPNKGVKLTALRAAAYAQNVRPSKHDATSGLAKHADLAIDHRHLHRSPQRDEAGAIGDGMPFTRAGYTGRPIIGSAATSPTNQEE